MPTTRRRLLQRSSASALLAGTPYRGKTIAGVYRDRGARRVLQFTDGTTRTVDRETVHALATLQGLLQYRARYLAASPAERRRMVRRSTARQQALLANHLARQRAALAALPPDQRAALQAQIRRLARRAQSVGSPLVGRPPAAALIAPASPVARVARDAGVVFRTVRRHGRTYVIPIREGAN
jgi:hypothetical protein